MGELAVSVGVAGTIRDAVEGAIIGVVFCRALWTVHHTLESGRVTEVAKRTLGHTSPRGVI